MQLKIPKKKKKKDSDIYSALLARVLIAKLLPQPPAPLILRSQYIYEGGRLISYFLFPSLQE